MHDATTTEELQTLADTLWAERRVVEFLLFKLITAKLVLAADERRFVAYALDEVERVLETLRAAEVRRAAALEPVARAWGVEADDLTLGELAARAPEPLASVFADHHETFLALTGEIEEAASENRRLASSSLTHVREALDALAGAGATEDVSDAISPVARPGQRLGRARCAAEGARARAHVGAQTSLTEARSIGSECLGQIARSEPWMDEDTDHAQAVMDLQVQDLAFGSALHALDQVLPRSLTSFLR